MVETRTNQRMAGRAFNERSTVSAVARRDGLARLEHEVCPNCQREFSGTNCRADVTASFRLSGIPKRWDYERRTGRAAAARGHAPRQRLHGHLHLMALEQVRARTHSMRGALVSR